MAEFVVILSTAGNEADARTIANTLVAEKLAACVLVQPNTTSYYVWEGQQENSQEVALLIKTMANKTTAIQQRFKTLHPYKVPAFMVLPVSAISDDYANWAKTNLAV